MTGGGIAANLARVLPQDTWVEVDRSTWSPPPVFRVLADLGGLELEATEGTWNLGIGFLAVVAADRAEAAASALAQDGIAAWQVGVVQDGTRPDAAGEFEQGAKGVDGGAVRLVGNLQRARSEVDPMCGIVGMVGQGSVNQEIYDSLLLLQHRGQDSTGIATAERNGVFHLVKAKGQVREAFRTRDMRGLLGDIGLGHVRYATKGTASSEEEAQPFYVNAPYGIVLVHNGNLTNTRELTDELFHKDRRHLNTSSDTELLVNVLANELQASISGLDLDPEQVFQAVTRVHERVEGSYAAIALIAGYGLLAFRDPFGIRPLILGTRKTRPAAYEWVVTSESLVLENGEFEVVRDVMPGEAVFIDLDGHLHTKQCAAEPEARAVLVRVRLPRPPRLDHERHLGLRGAAAPRRAPRRHDREVHPQGRDRRRHADPRLVAARRDAGGAQARARVPRGLLQEPLRRPDVHHARPGDAQEERAAEAQRDVERVQGQERAADRRLDRARHDVEGDHPDGAGCRCQDASRSPRPRPPVRYPHVYGINMPSRHELVAHGRTIPEIAEELGADYMVYQEVEDLKAAILEGSDVDDLDMSCFDGRYITGTVSEEYLAWVEGSQES